MVSPDRRLVVLVPDASGTAALARGAGPPTIDLTVADGETTLTTAWTILRDIGLQGSVLGCTVDQTDPAELAGAPRSALIELAPPPTGWVPPEGWRWLPSDALALDVPPGLELRTRHRISELRGERPIPDERAAWALPGWYEQACGWIERSLVDAGRSAPEAVVPVRFWGISAVMRVDAADRRSWFKASFPLFRHEAAITALLAELAPGMTAPVIAADPATGWLLLDDLGHETAANDPDTSRPAVEHLVRLQSKLRPHCEPLLAAGCLHRPLTGLAGELEAALASEIAQASAALPPDRIRSLVAAVDRSAAVIEAAGFPETLVHGDFHPGNVALTANGAVVFDWSDSAIGNPVVEAATWASWFDGDERREAALWTTFCSVWADGFAIDPLRIRRCDADVVAGAFHTVSYLRILTSLEPDARFEHADGFDQFFGLILRGTAAAQDP